MGDDLRKSTQALHLKISKKGTLPMEPKDPKDRLIFALDVPNKAEAVKLARALLPEVGMFKVGLELFMAEGPQLLRDLAQEIPPEKIFLDLKLYDIPATVLGALKTILPGLAFVTIPCDIGFAGLQKIAAQTGFKILAVTVLTSITSSELQELGLHSDFQDPARLVVRKADMARSAGCHGVVCSGREVKAVKEACGPDFLAVCPGIRPAWAAVAGDDQKRTVTPYEAIKNGADYIVVGRPIRTAPDPVAAARKVVEEIAAGMKG